ncbi:hypothetical protein LSUB1_G006800 [Neofusicoccum parvum]|uniref:Uncharacterized protein n=1 Tax=Neofusicoccum parvum TaxID=310453 RepID=A0ACB5SHD5_9PEZI|nr:hypothetical protein LSUB1_G006800 [Neofusicoccum parvum]
MEVLVLGLPRTATQSIADGLALLGYGPIYHMREVGKNKHQPSWIAALEAKFEGKGKEFGREEFDSFLSGYSGVSDYPAAIFAEELIAAYPDAKVILSIRDEDGWYNSMMDTLWHAWSTSKSEANPMRSLSDKYHEYMWKSDFPTNGRKLFQDHNELVRKVAPGGKFLEFNVKEGWGPLCAFLEKGVPDAPFPRKDDWAEYKASHQKAPK